MTDPNHPYGSPADSSDRPGKGMAIAALILGILALLFSWTVVVGIGAGLLALVLGLVASSRAKKGRAGGRVMAIIGAVLGLLGLLVAIAIIVAAVAFVNSDTARNLEECVSQAGDNQAAIDQCARDFQDQITN